MSFAKSKTKRFNDVEASGPPVGAYDPKSLDKVQSVNIDKGSIRFKDVKDSTGCGDLESSYGGSTSSISSISGATPKKKLFTTPVGKGSHKVAGKPPIFSTAELIKQRQLEAEIKKLLAERNELDKALHLKDGEIQRLEAKLIQSSRDKTSAITKIACLEKDLMDKQKSNECLKKEVAQSGLSVEKRKQMQAELTQLKTELNKKDKEMIELRKQVADTNSNLKAKLVESRENIKHLSHAKEQLEDAAKIEKKRLEADLTELKQHQDKLLNEKQFLVQSLDLAEQRQQNLEAEIKRVTSEGEKQLHSLRESMTEKEKLLNERIDQAVDAANGGKQSEEDCRASLQQYKDVLEAKVDSLGEEVRSVSAENSEKTDLIGRLKGELSAANDEMSQQKDELFRTQLEVTTLRDELQNVQEAEELLNENIKSLTDKHQILEADYARLEVTAKDREVNLEQELAVTKTNVRESTQKVEQLEQSNVNLIQALNEEKEQKETLQQRLEQTIREGQENEDKLLTKCSARNESLALVEKSKEDSQEKLQHFETVFKAIQSDKSDLEKQVQLLETNYKEVSNGNGRLQNKNAQLESDISLRESDLSFLETENQTLRTSLDEVYAQLSEAQQDRACLFAQHEQLMQQRTDLEAAMKDVQSRSKTINEQLNDLAQLSTEQEQSLSAKEGIINSLQAELAETEQRLQGTNENLERKQNELDILDMHKNELQSDISIVREELQAVSVELAELRETHREEAETRNRELGEMKEREREMEEGMEEWKEKVAEMADDRLLLERQIHNHTEAMSSQAKDMLSLRANNTELEQDLASREEQAQMFEQNFKQSQQQQQQYKMMIESEKLETERLTNERDLLIQQVQELHDKIQQLTADIQQTNEELSEGRADNTALRDQVQAQEHTQQLVSKLTQRFTTLEAEKSEESQRLRQKLAETEEMHAKSQQRCVDIETQHQLLREEERIENEKLLAEKETSLEQVQMRLCATEAELQSAVHEYQAQIELDRRAYEHKLASARKELNECTHAVDTASLRAEIDKWRCMYQELYNKVEPFQDQLEAFQTEKEALLGMNKDAKSEVEKLGRDYAKLLGHHNQKQKIKHVLKLKEENQSLKSDVTKLREQTVKQARQIRKLEERLDRAEGRSRFDVTKAFSCGKENLVETPARSPFREGNRK